jgi:peptide-methionine (S)-S-oxide reductase
MKKSILFLIFVIGFTVYSLTNKKVEMNNQDNTEYATFGGGCFWCTEAVFSELKGVKSVESGYAGGHTKNPTYKDICTGTTGHAEVIHITFNPKVIKYEELLDVFFATHNPTTLNRQGADVGTQYRSVIFYHNVEQKQKAINFIKQLEQEAVFDDKIVTEVTPFNNYYKAEDYHQDYYANNKTQRYCNAVINPKLVKFRKKFKDKLKK